MTDTDMMEIDLAWEASEWGDRPVTRATVRQFARELWPGLTQVDVIQLTGPGGGWPVVRLHGPVDVIDRIHREYFQDDES